MTDLDPTMVDALDLLFIAITAGICAVVMHLVISND